MAEGVFLDIRGFIARADELGVGSSLKFLTEVDNINLRRRQRVIDLAVAELEDPGHKKVSVLGISFKPDSDDLRDSPALDIALGLQSKGAQVIVHDPVSLAALEAWQTGLSVAEDVLEATKDADLIILGTEWAEYRKLDPSTLNPKTKTIIDGRNVLSVNDWQKAGFKVIALGRNIQNG